MLKAKDLRDQSKDELEAKRDELEKELFVLKSKLKTERKLENTHKIGELRKSRARIMTILSERENDNE